MMHTGVPRSKNQKKKPGWKKEQEDYEAWLKKINAMSCFGDKRKLHASKEPKHSVAPEIRETRPKSLGSFVTGGTGKKVADPRIMYREDPEMQEREIRARERKFMTAPLYNKGAEMHVTEETLKDIMSGATRRRN